MKLIPITKGKFAMVDDDMFDRLSAFKWFAQHSGNTWYACRHPPMIMGKRIGLIHMHRVVLEKHRRRGKVDHRDRNGLNNQRSNLRPATNLGNAANKAPGVTNKTGYKGVFFFKSRNKYSANIQSKNGDAFLGYYDSPVDAAKAYNEAAKAAYGEFAYLNPV